MTDSAIWRNPFFPAVRGGKAFGPARQRPGTGLFDFQGERVRLQRRYSLKKNAQFKYVRRRGVSGGSHELVMLYVRSSTLKVGFSVGKKLGCAVERNRVKRRLRAAVVPLLPRMKRGLYVFIAREHAAKEDFSRLCRTVQSLLRRQNLLLAEEAAGADGASCRQEEGAQR